VGGPFFARRKIAKPENRIGPVKTESSRNPDAVRREDPRCLSVAPILSRSAHDRSSLDRWHTRRTQPISKSQEDRQFLIDGCHLFPSEFAKYAPDPPLIDGSQMVNRRGGLFDEAGGLCKDRRSSSRLRRTLFSKYDHTAVVEPLPRLLSAAEAHVGGAVASGDGAPIEGGVLN
jgi:hypothetical protein